MAAALVVGCYVAFINLLAFELFRSDKRRALTSDWRISEATLLLTALAGGWLGAKAGQRRFRHKTRKQPFARQLNAMGVASLGMAIAIGAILGLAPMARGLDWADLSPDSVLAGDDGPDDAGPAPDARPRRFGPGSGDGM